MKVYRIRTDVNHYQYFLPEHEEEWPKFEMDCTPMMEIWVPPSVFIYKIRHKRGDFFNFGLGVLITNPKATEVLRSYLEMAGELLPLPHDGDKYTVLNVLECNNCLDHAKTEWAYDQISGTRTEIKKYVFHPNRFSESRIFKIPETSKSEILVVEWKEGAENEFRYTVETNGLKGLVFEEIWSS